MKSTKTKTPAYTGALVLVNHHVFGWNSLLEDITLLYKRLVELGMEYRDGEVYLADLE